ncbi:MAG: hypothetical protein R3B91_06105 [Planctomycetaceae bacterium]
MAARFSLVEAYSREKRHDLALKYLEEVLETAKQSPNEVPDRIRVYSQQQSSDDQLNELRTMVSQFSEQVDTDLQSAANRVQIAQLAFAAGFPLKALEVLEGDLTIVARDPNAQMLMSMLLLEVGRTEEAFNQIEGLRGSVVESQVPDWPILAAYCNHAADELGTAISTLAESHERLLDAITTALLESAPLRFAGPILSPQGLLDWGGGELMSPLRQVQNAGALTTSMEMQLEQNELMRAFLSIETGDNQAALSIFESLIERQPSSIVRPTIEVYAQLLGGDPLPPAPDQDAVDATFTEFGDLIEGTVEASATDESVTEDSVAEEPSPAPDLTTLPPIEEALQSRPLVPEEESEN